MDDIDAHNGTAYEDGDVVDFYRTFSHLQAPERKLFELLAPFIDGRRVLDIGVGGGRTTALLLPRAGQYVGLDYAPSLVAATRERFPGADIRLADARDLGQFARGSFDLVLFSFNGLDSIGHDGRLQALLEMRRVLADDGRFLFSSHNRDYQGLRRYPWQVRNPLNPAIVRASLTTLRALPRHLRMRRFEESTADHAIVNDPAHDYRLLLYYITIAAQTSQLETHGFTGVQAWSTTGEEVSSDSASAWIHYLARPAVP